MSGTPDPKRRLLSWSVDESGLIDLRHPRLPDDFFVTVKELAELVDDFPSIRTEVDRRIAALQQRQTERERARQARRSA